MFRTSVDGRQVTTSRNSGQISNENCEYLKNHSGRDHTSDIVSRSGSFDKGANSPALTNEVGAC